jgi:histidyl-tRNA synthetase
VFARPAAARGPPRGVGGGGRYDGLVQQLGGPATPGMGWAAGIERILLAGAAPASGTPAIDLFVAFEGRGDAAPSGGRDGSAASSTRAAFGVLRAARSAGLSAQMELAGRSLKNQLGHAGRLGARYVAIVDGGETTLRDMQGGDEQRMATGTIVHAVLRGLRDL